MRLRCELLRPFSAEFAFVSRRSICVMLRTEVQLASQSPNSPFRILGNCPSGHSSHLARDSSFKEKNGTKIAQFLHSSGRYYLFNSLFPISFIISYHFLLPPSFIRAHAAKAITPRECVAADRVRHSYAVPFKIKMVLFGVCELELKIITRETHTWCVCVCERQSQSN